jgi:arylsulfatase A-like enzyme
MLLLRTILLLAPVVFLLNCNTIKNATESVDERPNIIFLLADDMRYDALGCTGNKIAITPHLDSLAAAGTTFKNSYVTSSICCISRASILTGQYERRHGIDDFSKTFSDSAFKQTYPILLRNNGYYTGFIGKYGVGNSMPVKAFDYWKGFAGHGVYFYQQPGGIMLHETALIGNQAQEFITTRDKSKPFCLSISFKAPHSEDGVKENNGFRPDPFFNTWYSNTIFPLPHTYADSLYNQFPEAFRKDIRNKENEARVRFSQRFGTYEKFQTSVRAIYRLVSGIDKVVGELRNFLKEQGLDKNTIIVFTSDNGYYMGEHGLEGKWYGHEESIRVPLIVYDPRLKHRAVAEEMVLNIDVAPTILAWAGISTPAQMQGSAFNHLLQHSSNKWRKEFFYEHRYDPGSYPVYIPHTAGVVTRRYKYMRYYNDNFSDSVFYETLFYWTKDKYETDNLLLNKGYVSQRKRLQQKLKLYEKNLQ